MIYSTHWQKIVTERPTDRKSYVQKFQAWSLKTNKQTGNRNKQTGNRNKQTGNRNGMAWHGMDTLRIKNKCTIMTFNCDIYNVQVH